MKIWFVTSEAAPFAKTGGLGDVALSLPIALKKEGVDVRVILPKYGLIKNEFIQQMTYEGYTYINIGQKHQFVGVMKMEYEEVPFYFIDNESYFHRNWYYGDSDEGEIFTFFSKAALEVLNVIDFTPDIIHCNDWQTGIIPLIYKAHYKEYREERYRNIKTVFTIHNLRYQGIFPNEVMDSLLNLSWEYYKFDGIEYHNKVNFMKAGISYCDMLTTVSKTYAEEIKTIYYGENLSDSIWSANDKLRGIVNGINYDQFNPETDTKIPINFSWKKLSPKKECKKSLQKECRLKVDEKIPLIGVITRLVDQKGLDLLDRMIAEVLNMKLQLIVLGTGDKKYEDMLKWADSVFPGKMSANIMFDINLAQRIYAGCDMFLMPSQFEPCGLSQMISMRYGTVPIVRETGGLKDTVMPYNQNTGEGTGFTFQNYNAHEMKDAIIRALNIYNDKSIWKYIQKSGMKQDFSWKHSAVEYMNMYNELTN